MALWKIIIWIILGLSIFFLLRLLKTIILKIAIKSRTKYSFVLLVHLAKYLYLYFLLLAGFVYIKFFNLPVGFKSFSKEIILILFLLIISIPLLKFSDIFINNILRGFDKKVASISIIKNIVKILLISIIAIIILSSLKISIVPILGTLGIGGLTLAFALKDILANFFAGFYIITSKQFKVDDFVELETGEKGAIIDINWRTIQIKLLGDKVIAIPNAKFVESRVINNNLPDKELNVSVKAGVHYSSDLEFVEKVTLEVAKEVMKKVEGGVKKFEPVIRYNAFASSSIDFVVILRVKDFSCQFLVIHEFIKRLHARYKKENIIIPFPIVAVNKSQEK